MKAYPVICPYCEGKTRKGRKTLYLYPNTESYWCARCGKNGMIESLPFVPSIELETDTLITTPVYNGQGNRYSVCRDRNFDGVIDTFQMKYPNGIESGYHERRPNKVSRSHGGRTFGYREAFLNFNQTYRIVEGPYDCVYPNDVCVFGYPNKAQARLLKPYKLILCPDGDVWKEDKNVLRWLEPFLYNNIVGLERLPDDKDPDEVQECDRKLLDWELVRKKLKGLKYGNH